MFRRHLAKAAVLVGATVASGLGDAIGPMEALSAHARAAEAAVSTQAATYRESDEPVQARPDGNLHLEAAEFHPEHPSGEGGSEGWTVGAWGENYYAATFANTFLSRKAFLGAPAQADGARARVEVEVPERGHYLALVRYEAAYRFQTRFRVQIEQGGELKLDRLYGARENEKIWAFNRGIQPEVAWSWGAVENIVWEGHDATVDLEAGRATVRLIAVGQPEPAARRHVDLMMLTTDHEQVRHRLENEGFLPLDGMLTQAGDVHLRVTNHDDGPSHMTLNVPHGREHSPYWVHMRDWEPRAITVERGATSEWVEVGSLLDSLNDGSWIIAAHAGDEPRGSFSQRSGEWTDLPEDAGSLHYTVEFAVRDAVGELEAIARFTHAEPVLALAYDADTRYTRRIRRLESVLDDLLAYLEERPVQGRAPRETLIISRSFNRGYGDEAWGSKIERFVELMGITAPRGFEEPAVTPEGEQEPPRGYIDLRGQAPAELRESGRELVAAGRADEIAVVSLGDEISLPAAASDDHEGFRAWAREQGMRPSQIEPEAGDDWHRVRYTPEYEAARDQPRAYYYSTRYRHHHGIAEQKAMTDALVPHLPNAGVGSNFSPHHTAERHAYLGPVHKWVSLFRERGMTQPWSEDYIWQLPVGSQQMNFINLDLFRAGMRPHDDMKLHYYVMPHWPGNTPESWRRQFYGDLAHGMKIVNFFHLHPVHFTYTENSVTLPAMYQAVRRALHELGTFERIIQRGEVASGNAGLWFSEVGDIWRDNAPPFAAAKRTLYVALQHAELALDVVVEADAHDGTLDDYDVLYLSDRHVSRAAAEGIAAWVEAGGALIATAGAGLWDEYDRPNEPMRVLLGVAAVELEPAAREAVADESRIVFAKQDLPFAEPVDHVNWREGDELHELAAFGAVARLTPTDEGTVTGRFVDGSTAVIERTVGEGRVMTLGFLPGLSYFEPAIPRRPVDRGSLNEAMAHFIPTEFDPVSARLINHVAADLHRPVTSSEPMVSGRLIRARSGVAIPLVNWSDGPIENLRVTVAADVPMDEVALASGGEVTVQHAGQGSAVFIMDLDVADALILR